MNEPMLTVSKSMVIFGLSKETDILALLVALIHLILAIQLTPVFSKTDRAWLPC